MGGREGGREGRKEGNVSFAENINKCYVQHDCNTYGREGMFYLLKI